MMRQAVPLLGHQPHVAESMTESIRTPSTTVCTHFGECGGCQHQDAAYSAQLLEKVRVLEEGFAPFWSEPIPIEPSPEIWHYRNKIDPSFAGKYYEEAPPKGFERELVIGFKKRWYWTIDLEECLIAPEGAGALLAAVREWGRAEGLKPFDTRGGNADGFVRLLLVREGKRTGDRMVVLFTNEGEFAADGFLDAVKSAFPAQSVQRAVFTGKGEVMGADRIDLLEGDPHIYEELHIGEGDAQRRIRFRISPLSFFQTNTFAAERLYAQVRDCVSEIAPGHLYDLYGGSGAFAFVCSDLAQSIDSVEEVAPATADGEYNAVLNGIDNVKFTNAKVEHYLRDAVAGEIPFDREATVIADPPRPGFHPKALRRLLELGPRNLIYVSCKYKELLREMPAILEQYRLTKLSAVDMFPHTNHVEVLARFERV